MSSSGVIPEVFVIKKSPCHIENMFRIKKYFISLSYFFQFYFPDFYCPLLISDNGDNDHDLISTDPVFSCITGDDEGNRVFCVAVNYTESFSLDDRSLCEKIAFVMKSIGRFFRLNKSIGNDIPIYDLDLRICEQVMLYLLKEKISPIRYVL